MSALAASAPARHGVTPRRAQAAARAYQGLVLIYLAGLLVWLGLGLIPALADIAAPLHHGLVSLSSGSGLIATYARRVTNHSMPAEPLAWVALAYLFSALNLALGVLLMVKRPRDVVPRLLALAFMGTAATFNEPSHAVFHILGDPPLIKAVHFTFHVVSGVAYLWAVVLFPDGRAPVTRALSRRSSALVVVAVTAGVAVICWRSSFVAHPPFFVVFFGVLVPVAGMTAQSLHVRGSRLRGRGRAVRDEQSRLLRVALLPALATALVWLGAQALDEVQVGGALPAQVADAVQNVFPAVFALVPVVMFVAIVRHRLWDIDVIASRALLMASLVVFIGCVYVGCLGLTGWLLRDHGWAVLVPLVVVACVAEPLRRWCRRLCNRLVFGQQMSPREAVRSLMDRFGAQGESDADGDGDGDGDELTALTRAVVQSSRATSAAIWLVRGTELLRLAEFPAAARVAGVAKVAEVAKVAVPEGGLEAARSALLPARCWPVTYEGELLGIIAVTTPRGIALTGTESRLLDDLSHHAGLLVANAQLTVDLARELETVTARAAELQASRDRVVQAQDAQRRALESDIHDGAQQQIVALLIQLGVLRRATAAGKVRPEQVAQLKTVLSGAQDTLTRLASGGAPLVLAERGLRVALQEAADRATEGGIEVKLTFRGPEVSHEGAVAVYFCCLEALANVAKHARAQHVEIEVEADDREVRFRVTDDGAGFAAEASPSGSGMRNLASRLTALGGRVTVESAPGRGTTVGGSLPAVEAVLR